MMSPRETTSWHLAQIKPNGLALAERNLLRQGVQVFAPRVEETRRGRGGFVARQVLLFPGYIFVSVDGATADWRAVMSTRGVSRIVSMGGRPSPVPAALVAALRARCTPDGLLRPEADFAPGDAVRLTTGPFAAFVARVEEVAPDRRVWVLIELLGREARVAVPQSGLVPT